MSAEREIIESMFRIPDKEGKDVDFQLNSVQAMLDTNLSGRDIIAKARQRGISFYFIARNVAKCLAQRNRRCVMISHTTKATQVFIDRAHYILSHLKGGMKAQLKYSSRNEIYFEKMDSTLYIGTAGSDNVGIGDTITDLHCSEVPLWDNPQALLKGLFNAVPLSGNIAIESTGKGMGNWFHRQTMRAASGTSRYKLHFFSWTDAPEYRIELTPEEAEEFRRSLDNELEEVDLFNRKVLDLSQLAWRRDKLIEMDYDLEGFKEQYPITLDECFQGTGASYFKRINFVEVPDWHPHPTLLNFHVLGDHPKRGHSYFAGGDVGGGTGRDNSVLEIFDLDEMRQVGEWCSNRLEPHIFAERITPILYMFNSAYVNIERNNHGILALKILIDLYPKSKIHMSRPPSQKEIEEYGKIADYGTFTSVKNRLSIIASLRETVIKDIRIHSPILKSEMDSFVEDEATGKLQAQEGCLDDRVLAAAMATYIMPKAITRSAFGQKLRDQRKENDPFGLNSILVELEGKYVPDLQEDAS